MKTRSRLALAALAAVLVLGAAAGVASANRLSTSATSFTLTWRELYVPNTLEEPARCPLTLSGSFHARTFTKVRELLVGYVNAAQTSICTGGEATVLTATLPWHLTYQSFAGTLPAITSVRYSLIGFSMNIHVILLGERCLIRTTAVEPLPLDFERETTTGRITSVRIATPNNIRASGEVLCPTSWTIGGAPGTLEGPVGVRVTVTLI